MLPEIIARTTPLHRYPLLRSGSMEPACNGVSSRSPDASGIELGGHPGEFTATGNFIRLNNIALAYLSYGAAARIRCGAINAVRQQFCITGSATASFGSQRCHIDADRPCLIPAQDEAVYDFDDNFSQIVLYVDTAALRGVLSAVIGVPVSQNLIFETPTDAGKPELRRLRQLVQFLVSELDHDAAPSMPVLAELERSVLVSFLHANTHNFSRLLGRDARRVTPWQVRRAEEFVEANWQRPLTLRMIADATGVSARSLFNAFRAARGCSPTEYVKRVRLKQARQMLTSPTQHTSVTAVAFACGFDNPGHFSGNYRLAFGELPSQTLTKVRGPIAAQGCAVSA
jgi:AraC-like DNA-binding protein